MSDTTTDPTSTGGGARLRDSPADPGGATGGTGRDGVLVVGVFAFEVAASLLVAFKTQPVPGLLLVGAAFAVAVGWARRRQRHADALVSGQIASARRLLADGSHTAAWNEACAAARAAGGEYLRNAALAVMVGVALEERCHETARQILERIRPPWSVDPCLEAAIERADGGIDCATQALERARDRPTFNGAAVRLLIELYAEANQLERAIQIADEHLDLLKDHEVRTMIAWLETWGEPHQAAVLAVARTTWMSGAERAVRFPNRLAS